MFLSNPRKSFLLIAFCVTFLQACGSSQTNDNKAVLQIPETKSEFPFSTKEPEVYQGDFVVGDGKTEKKWHVARKGDKWRIDFFAGGDNARTSLKSDALYAIDHRQKMYVVRPAAGGTTDSGISFNDLTFSFFRGKEYSEFDDLGRENGLRKYRVRKAEPAMNDIFIYIDEASGMMVKQEFIERNGDTSGGSGAKYTYEIRNLKLDVDDSVFQIPAGYRKVTADEYRSQIKQK